MTNETQELLPVPRALHMIQVSAASVPCADVYIGDPHDKTDGFTEAYATSHYARQIRDEGYTHRASLSFNIYGRDMATVMAAVAYLKGVTQAVSRPTIADAPEED
jgi:hypothetical protein